MAGDDTKDPSVVHYTIVFSVYLPPLNTKKIIQHQHIYIHLAHDQQLVLVYNYYIKN